MAQNGINGIWKYCNRATTVWSSQHHYLWFITDDRFLSCCYLLCFPDPSCGATMKSWAEAVGHLKSFLMQLMPSAPRFPVLFKTPTLDGLDENGRMDWWTHHLIIIVDFLQLIISHQENSYPLDMPHLQHSQCHTVTPTFTLTLTLTNIKIKLAASQGRNCVAPASACWNSELTRIQVKGSRDPVVTSFIFFALYSISSCSCSSIFSISIRWPIPIVCVQKGWKHGAQEEWCALMGTNVLAIAVRLAETSDKWQVGKNIHSKHV